MSDFVTGVLSGVGGSAILLAVAGYLGRTLLHDLLTRDLERFKAQLQATHTVEIERLKGDLGRVAFEHQTRFASLHEKRADVIADLYGRLAYFKLLMNRLINPPDPLIAELEKQVGDAGNEFREYYFRNRIYFNEDLCKHLDSVNAKFWDAWVSYQISKGKQVEVKESFKYITRAFKVLSEEIDPIEKEIETAFRNLLEPPAKEKKSDG